MADVSVDLVSIFSWRLSDNRTQSFIIGSLRFSALSSSFHAIEEAIQEYNRMSKAVAATGGTIDKQQAIVVKRHYQKLISVLKQFALTHKEDLFDVLPKSYETAYTNYEAALWWSGRGKMMGSH